MSTANRAAGESGRIVVKGGERVGDVHRFDWEIPATIFGLLAVHPAIRQAEDGEARDAPHFAHDEWAVTHVPTGRDVLSGGDPRLCEAFAAAWGAHPWWGEGHPGRVDPEDVPADLWAAIWLFRKGLWRPKSAAEGR